MVKLTGGKKWDQDAILGLLIQRYKGVTLKELAALHGVSISRIGTLCDKGMAELHAMYPGLSVISGMIQKARNGMLGAPSSYAMASFESQAMLEFLYAVERDPFRAERPRRPPRISRQAREA